jgi:signal transduction histidine kinase
VEDFSAALEAAKLEALYQFAYGLSHEINNPLANISTRAQTLLANERDPERRRKLATIVQQAFRAHEMIADLMLFARPPALRKEPVDLAKLADTVVAELQHQAHEQGTSLRRTGDSGPFIANVDPTHMAVSLKAIEQNALEAVRTGGAVEVHSVLSTKYQVPSTLSSDPKSNIEDQLATPHFLLSTSDTGPGIPPEIRPHIFDPYFSGREAGRGLGLGLSKAWRIAQLHGGSIAVENQPGSGAKFTIALPNESQHR